MNFGRLTILWFVAFVTAAAAAEPVFPDDRTLGNPKAPVVMVEYLAPTCPHCARFNATAFPEIKKAYIDTGKVRYVIRIFPLASADGAVAGIAACQKPERYYDFLDLAFRKQAMWDPNGYDIPDLPAALVQLAGMVGMKPDDAKRCMEDKNEFARVNRIAEDGMNRHRIEAVPSIILDGQVLLGEDQASWPALKARLDKLLAPATATPAVRKPVVHRTAVHKTVGHKSVVHKSAAHKPVVHKPGRRKAVAPTPASPRKTPPARTKPVQPN